MDYPKYDSTYVTDQTHRIADVASKIAMRAEAVRAGRRIPEHQDLPIGTGRYLQAAVLFLDISAFTTRPSNTQEEQEALLRALNVFFTEMFRIVNDYNGVVEKNTGDGLMAYFEDNAESNGAERAVACAMTMKAAIKKLNPHIEKTTAPIEFRIGIDHGPITVARIAAPKLFGSIVAIGVSANIASKILRVAKAGDVVIGEQVADRLPEPWKKHCTFIAGSDFIYIQTGEEYPFYKYVGEWVEPAQTAVSPLSYLAPAPPPPPGKFTSPVGSDSMSSLALAMLNAGNRNKK